MEEAEDLRFRYVWFEEGGCFYFCGGVEDFGVVSIVVLKRGRR